MMPDERLREKRTREFKARLMFPLWVMVGIVLIVLVKVVNLYTRRRK